MPKIHLKLIFLFFAAFLIAFIALSVEFKKTLVINGQKIKVELAETVQEQREGLMYREELPENEGMLFVYAPGAAPNFWMKNTLIPLDMLFISSDKTINKIHTNVPPCPPEWGNDCPNYGSNAQSQYVLEVNAGYTEKHGIEVGDLVEF